MVSVGTTFAFFRLRALQCPPTRIFLHRASETNALRHPHAFNFCGTPMNPPIHLASPMAAELAPVDSQSSPFQIETPVTRNVWTRDIEALCRAVEAQQRASAPHKP
jgi:hypothetical protein